MIVRVKKWDIVYDTIVFAILENDWKTKIIVFDEAFELLEYARFYDTGRLPCLHKQIVIIDSSDEEWVQNGKLTGYDWIVNDPQLLALIDRGGDTPPEILARCLELQKKVCIPEWFEVTDEKSAENLLVAAGYFHDGYITSIGFENNETHITINVWGGKVHLRLFDACLSNKCKEGYGEIGEILDSNVFFENNRIFWVDAEHITRSNDMNDEYCYFSASKMLWNISLE